MPALRCLSHLALAIFWFMNRFLNVVFRGGMSSAKGVKLKHGLVNGNFNKTHAMFHFSPEAFLHLFYFLPFPQPECNQRIIVPIMFEGSPFLPFAHMSPVHPKISHYQSLFPHDSEIMCLIERPLLLRKVHWHWHCTSFRVGLNAWMTQRVYHMFIVATNTAASLDLSGGFMDYFSFTNYVFDQRKLSSEIFSPLLRPILHRWITTSESAGDDGQACLVPNREYLFSRCGHHNRLLNRCWWRCCKRRLQRFNLIFTRSQVAKETFEFRWIYASSGRYLFCLPIRFCSHSDGRAEPFLSLN